MGLQRKTPKQDRDLAAKLDAMDDDDVVSLFNGIGSYIKDHFVEIGGDGNDDGENNGGNERDGTSFVDRFFGDG